MDSRYKIIVSNKNLYKEIELPTDAKEIKLGTDVECNIRLHKSMFFDRIELVFLKNDSGWSVLCSDNLYLTVGDVRKLMTKNLVHGDSLTVKYQDSNNEAFSFDFLIDFDNGKTKYERAIALSGVNAFTIGSASTSNIVIGSSYVNGDAIELVRKNTSLQLFVRHSNYGVYHNGNRIEKRAEIKSGDFFSVSDFFFYFKNEMLWTELRSDMRVNSLNYRDYPTPHAYPMFSRNTRIKTVVNDEKIEILDPPTKPQRPRNNIISRLLPSIVMVVAGLAMSFVSPFMLISSGLGIVTAIVGLVQGKKDFQKDSAERIEKYNAYISNKRSEIEAIRNEERYALEEIYISPDIEQERLAAFSPELFDRAREDDDFLCVRVGTGDIEAKRQVNYKKQERLEVEDELQQMPEKIYNEYKNVRNAPIVCDLKTMNALGIVGEQAYRYELLKNIVMDLASRHFHTDVKMIFVAEQGNRDKIRWLRLLPHVFNDALGIRNIVCNAESRNIIFEYLYKELTFRESNKQKTPQIVVFFFDEYGFNSHPISKFIDTAKDLGVTFVFFGNSKADIPQGCDALIDIRDHEHACLINAQDKNESYDFVYPRLPTAEAERIVAMLSPVYTEEISLEGTLTKNISLFELLNIIGVDDIDLAAQWNRSQVFTSMAAPIGVSKAGIVALDLHDKAHGPHGLVAGTTGSGKSEILQTYILSMATLFHPYEVAFVIIDFKGGGMVNQFRELPHLLGAITNIDGKEIERSLKSIKAELQKRQRLFAEADVNHIDKYIRKYKNREVKTPLPHLIIIVDEFAELKAEQPEFMKELISAARIGRSLGVHLILATQKPAGQVNEQIWSNSRFKLCLKVQTQEDSNEVLKSPLAAEIKEPGRAYLQVGNNEIFELFQSAYSGAPERMDTSNVKEFAIYQLTDSGKRVPVFMQKKQKNGEGSTTQLDAIVNYVATYCAKTKLSKLPDICLPALSSVIPFPDRKTQSSFNNNIIADYGIYDDPDNQYQGLYSIDLTNENVIIIGSSQSGKTNALQSIIRSITTKYSPREVNLYIVDFASMVLKNYEKLNHVGGVVTPSEDEKLKNLFKLLKDDMTQRKEKMLSIGVSSFSAYRDAGMKDLPQIVLMIDNLTALKELYFQDDDELLNLCREGLSVGISVVIANSQTAGIGYKYLSNFSSRIALFCNDSGEYGSLFDHCRERIEDIHGRCIIEIDKMHLECQTFLAFPGEKEIERVAAIKDYVTTINNCYRKEHARAIPLIPEILTTTYIQENFAAYMQEPFTVIAGLNYASVSPLPIDLRSVGAIAISGRPGRGRHSFMRYIVTMLDTMYPNKTEVYIVDGLSRRLADLKGSANVCSYDFLPDRAAALMKSVEQRLVARYDALAQEQTNESDNKLIFILLNSRDAVEAICADTAALNAYKNITGRYKNMNVCIFVGDYENANVAYGAPEIIKKLKEAKQFLFFDDLANMKILDLPLAVMRAFKKPIDVGDCYYIKDNECYKLKTSLASVFEKTR